MKLFIAKDDYISEPGFYGFKGEAKTYGDFLNAEFRHHPHILTPIADPLSSVWSAGKALYNYLTDEEQLLKIGDIPKNALSDGNSIFNIFHLSKIIDKGSLIKREISYENPFFDGYFINNDHFKLALDLLVGNDSTIIICNKGMLSRFSKTEIIKSGIYIQDSYDEKRIHILSDYSISNWTDLRESMITVFGKLGINRLKIDDKSTIDASAAVEIDENLLKSMSVALGFSAKRHEEFSLDISFKPVFEPKQAKQSLYRLKHFNDLHALASHMIETNSKAKITNRTVTLDTSFGLNIRALSYLQGTFDVGHIRTIEISTE
jgi:hypothetical protein